MLLLIALLSTAGCPPAAAPTGPQAGALIEALARRGVAAPTAGCPAVTLRVETDAAGVRLTRAGHPAQQVPDVETAALLVETWVRADLIDPLLAARRGPPPPPAPVVVTAAPGATRQVFLQANAAGGTANERSTWVGVEGQGCIELGPTCTGLSARVLFDGGATGESERERVRRLALSVLVSAEVDLGLVRVGGGAGATTVRIDDKDSRSDDVRGAPLFEARVARAVALSDALALDVGLSGDLALWPRHGRRGDDTAAADDFPGQTRWMALAHVGLRWTL